MTSQALTKGSQAFRLYLQEELAARCRRNPKYSLRAFASGLMMDPSTLAKVLNGKRALGPRAILRLSEYLDLRPEDIERFTAPGRQGATMAPPQATYEQLAADSFEVIADWQHYAILELMTVESFRPDIGWVARSLSISPAEVRTAVDRLVRVGMLEVTTDGTWIDRSGGKTTAIPAAGLQGRTTSAFKRHQRQVLELAQVALNETQPALRDQTSMTLAIDRRRLDDARSLIKQFRRDLAALLCHTGKRTDVYHLSVSLYPVSHAETKET